MRLRSARIRNGGLIEAVLDAAGGTFYPLGISLSFAIAGLETFAVSVIEHNRVFVRTPLIPADHDNAVRFVENPERTVLSFHAIYRFFGIRHAKPCKMSTVRHHRPARAVSVSGPAIRPGELIQAAHARPFRVGLVAPSVRPFVYQGKCSAGSKRHPPIAGPDWATAFRRR